MDRKQQFKDVLINSSNSQNFEEWKHELGDKLNCKRNDMKCWTSLLPKLACEIDDTHCWKNKLPHIPCQQNDSQCWRNLLPHLPCKVQDHECWKQIKNGNVLRDVNSHQEKILNQPHREEGFNPMRNFERRFGGMVSSQNHVWIT